MVEDWSWSTVTSGSLKPAHCWLVFHLAGGPLAAEPEGYNWGVCATTGTVLTLMLAVEIGQHDTHGMSTVRARQEVAQLRHLVSVYPVRLVVPELAEPAFTEPAADGAGRYTGGE